MVVYVLYHVKFKFLEKYYEVISLEGLLAMKIFKLSERPQLGIFLKIIIY